MTDARSPDSGSEYPTFPPEQKERSLIKSDRLKSLSSKVSKAMEWDWMDFHLTYNDCVELYAPEHLVAPYVANHSTWFPQCALPMKATPIGQNSYDLLVGHYGALKFEVEIRIGLQLIPRDSSGIYRISSISLPDYNPPGYQVNFQGLFYLQEVPWSPTPASIQELERTLTLPSPLPKVITRWEWNLDLTVGVQFPLFIRQLPPSLIRNTSERLLRQIIKEVSHRLGQKVQQNFHQNLGANQ